MKCVLRVDAEIPNVPASSFSNPSGYVANDYVIVPKEGLYLLLVRGGYLLAPAHC